MVQTGMVSNGRSDSALSVSASASRALPKAAAMLAKELRGMILGLALPPGTALPSEPDLIEQSGLGRASVREAIRILEAEGLIVIRRGAHGGIFVSQPDVSSLSRSVAPFLTLSQAPLRDLITYRKIIEPPAARLASSVADAQSRLELKRLAEHNPGPGFVNEIAFHERVAQLAGNMLLRVLVVVPHNLLRAHLQGESISDEDVTEANEAHTAIASAIAAGNGERADRAMAKHLDAFERRMDREGRLDRPIIPREQWLRDVPEDFRVMSVFEGVLGRPDDGRAVG
jgi:GntR family transcriptional repressor for pyruvate dehydrogenase complex